MKYIVLTIAMLHTMFLCAQRIDPHGFDHPVEMNLTDDTGAGISNDTTIDVNFYHIDISISLDSAYIAGNVGYKMKSLIDGLTSLKLDLDSTFLIDSVSEQVSGISRNGNVLTVNMTESYNNGDDIVFNIYYSGEPVLAGGYKGLRYETHDNNELVIATLSTPYLAHTWWPCKDGTEDKSDSTFIDITIKDTTISSIPVIALSNGVLDTVVDLGEEKTFKWKHKYPIVPYYVMAAISNYIHFQQTFEKDDYSFPIDYYVFESHLSSAENGVALLPDAMNFYSDIFGPYPFRDEKYGMTQLGFYGAIENQTNTITNNMDISWFYISIHELAHMWFADMITCKTWHHGWLNEGFANYAEALYAEYKYDEYQTYMENFEYYNAGTLYLEDVSNPFNVFQSIIYNKGAYVLHMLRGVVGDSNFFDIIYNYPTDPEFMYKQAITSDFQDICESVSGMDLEYFFDQWIYDERFPMYRYNYAQVNDNLEVAVNQLQGIMYWREVFEMPMEIAVDFSDGTDTTFIVFNNEVNAVYSFEVDKEVINVVPDPDKWILKQMERDTSISVGMKDKKYYTYKVYPNPGNGSFWIQPEGDFKSNNLTISVYDLNGRLQYEKVKDIETNGKIYLELPEIMSGIYVLNINDGLENYQTKLSVVKD